MRSPESRGCRAAQDRPGCGRDARRTAKAGASGLSANVRDVSVCNRPTKQASARYHPALALLVRTRAVVGDAFAPARPREAEPAGVASGFRRAREGTVRASLKRPAVMDAEPPTRIGLVDPRRRGVKHEPDEQGDRTKRVIDGAVHV
jgi:hypothetical protein